MSNTCPKRTFSSANFTLLICSIFLICTYLFKTVKPISSNPASAAFEVICLSIMLVGFGLALYIKLPIFIEPNPAPKLNEDFYDNKYTQNLSWFKCLYFALFTAERSQFVSFFSGATITIYEKGRVCKFIWENQSVKLIHRILDFLLLLLIAPILYFLLWGYLNFDILSGISICIVGTMFLFRKRILFNILSINVGKTYGYKLNVIYPYSTAKLRPYKYYGVAEPFTKTILITEDTFCLNPMIKEYVTAHEAGHLKDKKIFLTHFLMPIFIMVYVSTIPYLLKNFAAWAAFIPLITYLIYKIIISYKINEDTEFFADSFALKTIGKEKCVEALTLMSKDSRSNEKNKFFTKAVPLERKIQFINDYKEEKS